MKSITQIATLLLATTATASVIAGNSAQSFDCGPLASQITQPGFNISAAIAEITTSNVTLYDLVSSCGKYIPKDVPAGGSVQTAEASGCNRNACNLCMVLCTLWSWFPPAWGM